MWVEIRDGNPVARQLFRRHYSYRKSRDQINLFPEKNRNYLLFGGPGEKLILLTECQRALFVWRKFISMDDQKGVSCAVFRNEGAGRASDLIIEADRLAWQRWPGERLYTYVDPDKVKSPNPGYCFKVAGYQRCGTTKGGLLIFEKLPSVPTGD